MPRIAPAALFLSETLPFLGAGTLTCLGSGQWMWDGLMEFILLANDPRSKLLRRGYVFKIVPIINPGPDASCFTLVPTADT
eukprot:298976-Rhodomonas_salina.1